MKEAEKISLEKNPVSLVQYYRCQKDICLKSELFGANIFEHDSKVLMLFAEVYSFLVEEYGVNTTFSAIINFENSDIFKNWFWKIKHRLGWVILKDPTFCEIGEWIGRGLFLKIALNICTYNNLSISDNFINRMSKKQKSLIIELNKRNCLNANGNNTIEFLVDGYVLLKEKTILSNNNNSFVEDNILK